uniref:Putative secreted protein n=1 Tax=Anopheles triannulatus TaxID=58253 RepID=A0A2M4B1P6_9DIPT
MVHRVEVGLCVFGLLEALECLLVRAGWRCGEDGGHNLALVPGQIGQTVVELSENVPAGRIVRIQLDRTLHVLLDRFQLRNALLDAI